MNHVQTHGISTTHRTAFMNRVFAFFGLAILLSAGGVLLGIELLVRFPVLFTHPLFTFGTIAVELAILFTARTWMQIRGLNYAMFLLFTILSGFTAVPILVVAGMVGGAGLIAKALFATVAMFGGVALYGALTQRDLSGMGGFLVIALIGIIVASLINLFVQSSWMSYVASWISVVVFAGFTMYDVQMIKTRYTDDMYLMAALALYLDFFNMFLNVLNIMLASRD